MIILRCPMRKHAKSLTAIGAVGALAATLLTGTASTPAFAAAHRSVTTDVSNSVLSGNTIFWTTPYAAPNTIFYGPLGGGAPATLNTTGATVDEPWGLAVDPAGGKVYWANYGSTKISWARLNGTGGGDLNPGAATVNGPSGVVVDHALGKIYWANSNGDKISWANLNGSGGGDLNTGTATVNNPVGVAIDNASGKIYWANYSGNSISFAKLNGTGGGNLNITGTTVSEPWAVTINSTTRRIYWGNFTTNSLDYANLDGTGGGVLSTTGADQSGPMPGSLNPATGRLYWANWLSPQEGIVSARADGTGGGTVLYPLSTQPAIPVVLTKPSGAGAPVITGSSATDNKLSCSTGRWAADLVGEQLYRAPARFTYRWTKNGSPIAGATAKTFTTRTAGTFRCVVTASNAAGSTTQTSAALGVWAPHPDAMIKKQASPQYTGNDVYNLTGVRQSIRAAARRGTTVVFDVRVQNDGQKADTFTVSAPGNWPNFSVHYLAGTSGGKDITFPVTHGNYTLANVPAHQSRYLRLVVNVLRGAHVGGVRSWRVLATSAHDTTRKDAVSSTVTVAAG